MKQLYTLLLSFYAFLTIAQEKPQPVAEIPVNTKARESAFSISGDGKTAVFVSDKKLYACTLYGTAWGKPKPLKLINETLANHHVISATSLSQNGNYLYFSVNFTGGLGDEDIYYAVKEYGEWSEPINIGEPINTAYYDGYPCISNDGKKLYFVRDIFKKKGQESCYEIWVSNKEIGETWGVPKRLPYPVNEDCERNPRPMTDGKSLIISSLRDGGMGGFDFYETEKQPDGTWSQPIALEFMNSSANENFISLSGSNEVAYFERDSDIFSVDFPKIFRGATKVLTSGIIRDSVSQKPISAQIRFQNKTKGSSFSVFSSPIDGSYRANLDLGSQYILTILADDFWQKSATIDLSQAKENEVISKDFLLHLSIQNYAFDILDEAHNEHLKNATLKVISTDSSERILPQIIDNQLVMKLKIGNNYQIMFEEKGFFPKKENFLANVTNIKNYFLVKKMPIENPKNAAEIIHKNVILKENPNNNIFTSKNDPTFSLKKDSTYTFKDVYFVYNYTSIRSEAYGDLNRLLYILRENQATKLIISAYAETSKNSNIAIERAKNIAKYLTDAGIEKNRISVKGINETQNKRNYQVDFYLY